MGPTHNKGHTLDLVLTRAEDRCVFNVSIDHTMPSDHAAVHFITSTQRPPAAKITKQHRVLTNLNNDALKDTIVSSLADE